MSSSLAVCANAQIAAVVAQLCANLRAATALVQSPGGSFNDSDGEHTTAISTLEHETRSKQTSDKSAPRFFGAGATTVVSAALWLGSAICLRKGPTAT